MSVRPWFQDMGVMSTIGDMPPTKKIWNPRADGRSLREVGWAFSKLGLISFGGPMAHLGYLREEFVNQRRWLDDDAYGDIVALCQFLPGPSSSQVVFALGRQRAGWLGGLLASFCFTLPSAIMMILFGYGVSVSDMLRNAGWLHDLQLAAVPVVAQAVLGMGRNHCPDRTRLMIAFSAAALLLMLPQSWVQVGAIFGGGLIGWLIYQGPTTHARNAEPPDWKHHLVAGACLASFFLLLFFLPALASSIGSMKLAVFGSFYRAGSLVFGGGHVILPLLREQVVPTGWVADDKFLAGYGAAQALPGPLFTFAGYLGTVIWAGPGAWRGGVWCLLAIFFPSWLLINGTLPFWHQLRAKQRMQAALRGTNAAVVGVLFAALYNPVWTEGVKSAADAATAVIAFGLLQWWKAPSWMVVALVVLAGALLRA